MKTQTIDQFDSIGAEQSEIIRLIQSGMSFRTQKQSLFKFFGAPEQTFILHEPFLGTLNQLSREWLAMDFAEGALQVDSINEAKRLTAQNTHRCARIIAIAYLNSWWKIRFLTPIYARYFLWHLTPEKMWQLTILINSISNLGNLVNSVRYLSIQPRTTAPALMEKPEIGDQD
ncbi:hypothetical protein GCM10028808_60670 [Spirosoma migulaei]